MVIAIVVVIIVLAGLGAAFFTAKSNGEITDRLATTCVENGGAWHVGDGWDDEKTGCVR